MITIYNQLESTFLSDGLGVLDPIVTEALITEEINGAYYLELTAVIDDDGQWELLDYDNIIKANGQLFRILDIDKDESYIRVKAPHIFYDLSNNFLEDVAPTDKNGADALNWILDRTQFASPFVGDSDIADLHTARYVRKNVTEAIMGDLDNSMLNVWGGELKRNNYAIELLSRLGADNGVEISYGKNITGILETIYKNNVATRIMPQGFDGLLLPEKYVDSPYIMSYPMPIVRKVEFPDIKVNDDPAMGDIVTEAQAFDMLRSEAAKLFSVGKIDLPIVNYKVNFVDLTQTQEYQQYKVLETVSLGDTVKIDHTRLKISVSARAIKTVWDVLGKRYFEIQLGNFDINLNSFIRHIAASVANTSEAKFLTAIETASELIRTGFGGYVTKTRDELLIMDTENTATAQKVWRWNINGLGYSSTGYNGIYGLAMTMDGKINADMILVGKLKAQYIQADSLSAISANLGEVTLGVMRSADNTLRIDLVNKTFSIGSGTESVHTDLQYNGMQVKDGNELIAAFGESGAIIPSAEIQAIYNEFVMQRRYSATVSVGSGGTYSSIAQALDALFPNGSRFIWGTVTINVVSNLNEIVNLNYLYGGTLTINFGTYTLSGAVYSNHSTARIILAGGGDTSRARLNGISGHYLVDINNCPNVSLLYFNCSRNAGGEVAFRAAGRSNMLVAGVDFGSNFYYAALSDGATITMYYCRGNVTLIGDARYGGKIYAKGSMPVGSFRKADFGFIFEDAVTQVASTFSPPPITSQTFTQVFTSATFDTLVHGTTNVDSYYGSAAAQNRWDSSMGWKDGRIRVGADVFNFFNGGSSISIRMRLRRKNTTHGNSGAVYPAPYNHSASFPSGALRGGWTGWAAVSSSLFTSGGATLTYYNGVSGSSGYAIWDAIEIEVTVTKNV